MKLASLLPSATEIICQLGLQEKLIGISHECDYPESVCPLPRLTGSRINHKDESSHIHKSVEHLMKKAISIYDLDVNLLRTLQPDYIITQDLCDVCAVSFDQVESACREILGGQAKIISLRPNFLSDIWNDIKQLGKVFSVEDKYQIYHQDVEQRVEFIRKTIKQSGKSKKRTLTIEWIDPIFIGGMWVPEMIEIAGGIPLLANPGKPALKIDQSSLKEIDPEVVLIKPCGFKMEQTLKEIVALNSNIPWSAWTAAHQNRIFLIDGNSYFNRPGPRIINSLEILAYCIHPELFPKFLKQYSKGFKKLENRLQSDTNSFSFISL